jgi:ECF transporter S component (folate family)
VRSAIIQRKGGEAMNINLTRRMVLMALLVALGIVLTRFLSLRFAIGSIEGVRIGFGGFPAIFGGIILGPLAGGVIGAITDVLGFLINPMGPYMPHFTITAALTGAIPGFIYIYMLKNKSTWINLILAISIGQIITSLLLTPYFLQSIFEIPMTVTMIPRLVGQAINIPIYVWLTKVINERGIQKLYMTHKTREA